MARTSQLDPILWIGRAAPAEFAIPSLAGGHTQQLLANGIVRRMTMSACEFAAVQSAHRGEQG